MAVDLGLTTLGTLDGEELLSSAVWAPRTRDIVVLLGEGALAKGTLMMLDPNNTGKYVKHTGAANIQGYLNEAVDATSADVKTYLCFDAEVNLSEMVSASTITAGFDATSLLNIKEAQ